MATFAQLLTDVNGRKFILLTDNLGRSRTINSPAMLSYNYATPQNEYYISQAGTAQWTAEISTLTVVPGAIGDAPAVKMADLQAMLNFFEGLTAATIPNPLPVTGTFTVAPAVGLDRSFNTGSPNIIVTPNSTRVALLAVETFADFYLQMLTISEDSNSGSLVEVFLNPTVAGVFTYGAIQNSITTGAVGTAANTAVIGAGTLLYSAQLNKGVTEAVFDLSKLGKVVLGNKIVVCVTVMLNNTRMRASLNWKELS